MDGTPSGEEPHELHDAGSGVVYRLRLPSLTGKPGTVLLHGYGGNEKVLWVIETAVSSGGLVTAPRGIFSAAGGGYAWTEHDFGPGGRLVDFAPAVGPVSHWIETLVVEHGLLVSDSYMAGFSQGAALAFALTASAGVRPRGLVALAAYLPDGDLGGLAGVPIFWGHGTQDERVPVERARKDVARLRAAGAQVVYCESDTGHKVGLDCMRALRQWVDAPRA
jgi:phospholipase/carboxylesterase